MKTQKEELGMQFVTVASSRVAGILPWGVAGIPNIYHALKREVSTSLPAHKTSWMVGRLSIRLPKMGYWTYVQVRNVQFGPVVFVWGGVLVASGRLCGYVTMWIGSKNS